MRVIKLQLQLCGNIDILAVAAMPRSRPSVCRCLFGRPNKGDVDRFLEEAEQRLDDEAARRWDFDFREGRPLTDIDGKSQRYEWTAVQNCESIPSVHNEMLNSTGRAQSTVAEEVSLDVTESPQTEETTSSNVNTVSSEMSTGDTTPQASAEDSTEGSESNHVTHCESHDISLN